MRVVEDWCHYVRRLSFQRVFSAAARAASLAAARPDSASSASTADAAWPVSASSPSAVSSRAAVLAARADARVTSLRPYHTA